MNKTIRSRKFRGGAYATAVSFLLIVVLVIVNLVSGSLFDRIDVTSTRKYSLAEDTINFVKSVTTPIDLYYVTAEGEEDLIIKTGAELIADANDGFTFTVKDPIQYPQFVYRYNKMQDITNNSIIVVNADDPDRYEYIDSEQMKIYSYNMQTYQQELYGYDAEVEIAKAIIKVTQEKKATIYATNNHSEIITNPTDSEAERKGKVTPTFSDLLNLNSYEIKYCDLTKEGRVPEHCDILFIGAPQSDFTEAEVDAVKEFLTNGGTVFISVLYNTDSFTNLQELLRYYGVHYGSGVLFEGDSSRTAGDNRTMILSDYDGKSVEWPLAVPFYTNDTTRSTTKKTVLVETSAKAYRKETDASSSEVQPGDEVGKFPLLLKIEETFGGNTAQMYVFSSFYFFDDRMLTGSSSFANRVQLIECLNDSVGAEEDTLSIPDTTALEEALRMTTSQRNRIAAVSFILPGLILFAGVVVMLRRRVEKLTAVTEKGEE